jgi:hypothetical protein
LLIAGADLRQRLGAAGRHRYEQEFRFEHMLERTVSLYRRLHTRAAGPTPATTKLAARVPS